jgi:hypothetical protein
VQILDQNKIVLQGGAFPLTPNVPVTIFVRLTIPDATNTTPFSLSLAVSASGVTGNSGLTSYTVGQPPTPVDQTIDLTLTNANPSSALSKSTIQLPIGSSVILTYLAKFTVAGQYTISLLASANATNWFFALSDPTPDPLSTTQATINVQGSAGSLPPSNIVFGVRPQANATSGGTLQLKIQRQGAPAPKMQTLSLQVVVPSPL